MVIDYTNVVVENGVEVLYRYKYLPFNEHSLKMITEGTLKFTCPLEFNDPFDCSPAYNRESIEKVLKRRPDLLKRAGDAAGLSPAQRLQNKGRFMQNARNAVDSGSYVKALVSHISVFCVSRTPNNVLMWSHYAEHHRGFVVELRLATDAPKHDLMGLIPHPVHYQDTRPVFDFLPKEEHLVGYFFTKSNDWAYEQEERVFTSKRRAGIYPYSRKHFLCSVIAGAKMSPEHRQQLQQAVDKATAEIGKPIPLYQAKLATHSYQVYIPEHPSPDISREN